MNSKSLHTWMPELRSSGWAAIVLQIAAVSGVSGAIAYVATNPAPLVPAAAATAVHAITPRIPVSPPVSAPVTDAPVSIANPFDASEVFQFPAGTSEMAARQAVADTLLQRARDRVHLWSRK